MKNIFFTLIDKNYILRAYTLYNSIKEFLENDYFYIVCLDNKSYNFFKLVKHSNLKLLFINRTNKLLINRIRNSRPYNEFCWTMKAISFDYFQKFKNNKWIVYLDSDSMVFSSINGYLDDNFDAIITPHRSRCNYFKSLEKKVGKFNAGFIAFRNSLNGKKILSYWKKKCLESVSSKPDNLIYGDQKYLNEIEHMFKKVNSDPFPGLNLAPWNLCDNTGIINLNNINKIVFYHMQGLKIYNKYIYQIYSENFKVNKNTFERVYKPYIYLLRATYDDLIKLDGDFKQKKEIKIDLKFLMKNFLLKKNNIKIIFNNK